MPRVIGLGCMRLSTEAARPDATTARAIIDAAIAAGITLVDTADVYCHSDAELGHNERLLANLPTHVRIVTKGGLTRPDGAWVPNGRAKHLASAARASLDRLGRIDLYLLHVIDPKVALATSVRALSRLVEDDIVPAIGLSNVNLTQLESALAIASIAAVEIELHPYKLDALRGGLVDACTRRGIEVLAYRPLGGPRGIARFSRDPIVRSNATRVGCTPAELILGWLRSLSPMVVPLPGASRVETAISAAKIIEIDEGAKYALDEQFVTVGVSKGRSPVGGAATREGTSAEFKLGDLHRGESPSVAADFKFDERRSDREPDIGEIKPSDPARVTAEFKSHDRDVHALDRSESASVTADFKFDERRSDREPYIGEIKPSDPARVTAEFKFDEPRSVRERNIGEIKPGDPARVGAEFKLGDRDVHDINRGESASVTADFKFDELRSDREPDIGEIIRGDRARPSADFKFDELRSDREPYIGEIKPGDPRVSAEFKSGDHDVGEIKPAGEVVLVLGIPGAGKSTLARGLVERGYLRLNRDERGGSLLDLARALDEDLANGATRAVLDNTYPSRASRRPVIEIARRHGLAIRCIVVDTPIERAQHNAVLRMLDKHGRLLEPAELRGPDIGPGAQFRWRREYEPPREDEGFDEIAIVPFAKLALADSVRERDRAAHDDHDRATRDDRDAHDDRAAPDDPAAHDERDANHDGATRDDHTAHDDGATRDDRTARDSRATHDERDANHDGATREDGTTRDDRATRDDRRAPRDERQPAILVELDDIVWRGKPRTVEKVALHDGALDALRAWHRAGYAIAATSWQPGVMPVKFAELVERLGKMLDVSLRVSACFHAAGPPVCWCRKPLPGLALAMAMQHRLRFEVCVGSGAADKGFALRADVPYHDVREGWPRPGTMVR